MKMIELELLSREYRDITAMIDERLAGIIEGAAIVTIDSPAAFLLLSEPDEDILADIDEELTKIFPPRVDYSRGTEPYLAVSRTLAAFAGQIKELIIENGQRTDRHKHVYVYSLMSGKTALAIETI